MTTTIQNSVISVTGLTRKFISDRGEVTPVRDLSFDLQEGEVLAVLGQSGCGKTTLLRLLAGLEMQDAGTVEMKSGIRCGFVFQDPRLLPWKTVSENIGLALLHAPKGIDEAKALSDVLELVGLSDAKNAYPDELSGGMAQRVGLARALVFHPDVLFLDEPFGALDALTRRRMQRELAQILSASRVAAVMVTHDVSEAVLLADTVVRMQDGKFAERWTVSGERPRAGLDGELLQLEETILNSLIGSNE